MLPLYDQQRVILRKAQKSFPYVPFAFRIPSSNPGQNTVPGVATGLNSINLSISAVTPAAPCKNHRYRFGCDQYGDIT